MQLDDLISFLDTSPSPWHAATTATLRLVAAGFTPVDISTAAANPPRLWACRMPHPSSRQRRRVSITTPRARAKSDR